MIMYYLSFMSFHCSHIIPSIILHAQGLKAFKLDWMSVWKFIVPHRDPSLLPRQWRIALGTQRSYKQDEAKKERRRLYESERRKRKAVDLMNWQHASDKEVCLPFRSWTDVFPFTLLSSPSLVRLQCMIFKKKWICQRLSI